MNKTIKVTLIVGAVLVGLGLIIFLVGGFLNGWQFVSTTWEDKIYESESGVEITDIDLEFAAGTLDVQFYDGDVIKVEYAENDQFTTECEVKNTTLKITSIVRWHVQFLWFNKIPTTKVYIPQNLQLGLKLRAEAGVITVKEGTFGNVDIKMDAGTLTMDKVKCNNFVVNMDAGTMKLSKVESNKFSAQLDAGTLNVTSLKCDNVDLELSAGSAKIGIEGKKSDYTIVADVSAGSCNVKNQSGTTSKTLKVDVSAGSVKISFVD